MFDFPSPATPGQVYTNGGVSYAFDGLVWNIVASAAAATVGDVKHGFQAADHTGWVRLDGRAVTTLTATQQAAAATLGFTTNLPDATDAVLRQQAGALGTVGGSWKITQAMLPAINLTANMGNTANTTTSSAGASATATSSSAGEHTHSVYKTDNPSTPIQFTEFNANNDTDGIYFSSTNGGWHRTDPAANPRGGAVTAVYRAGAHTHTMSTPNHTHTVDIPDHNHLVPLGGTGADFLPKVVIANAFVYLGV